MNLDSLDQWRGHRMSTGSNGTSIKLSNMNSWLLFSKVGVSADFSPDVEEFPFSVFPESNA